MYKAGVIGLGNIAWAIDEDPKRKGVWSHVKAFDISTHTALQSVSSRNENICKEVQSKYNIPSSYTDYRLMLATESLDIVSICTPIQTHHEIVMDCIDAGVRAIFCEKTLSYNIDEAEEIVATCDHRGIILAVNYIKRWDGMYCHVERLLAESVIGEMQTIAGFGATALYTSTSHLIDLMCLFAGTPLWVVGEVPEAFVRSVHGVDDPGGIGMVRFDSGAIGFIKGTSLSPAKYMSELDILGSHGRIRISDDGKNLEVFRFEESSSSPGSGYESLVKVNNACPPKNERMIDAVQDIVSCIQSGQRPKSNGHSSLMAMKIVEGIRRSSASGNVKIDL